MSCSGVDGLLNIWRKRSPPFNCLFLIFIVAGGLLFLLGNLFVPWGMVYMEVPPLICVENMLDMTYDMRYLISSLVTVKILLLKSSLYESVFHFS